MALLSPIDLVTGSDDVIVIVVKRTITDLDQLSELVLKLRELDGLYVEVMQSHTDQSIKHRIAPAQIESIYSNSPIEISINVDLTYIGVALLVLKIIEKYPSYREGAGLITSDLKFVLEKIDGLFEEQIEYIRLNVKVALDAYCKDGVEAWTGLRNRAREIRDFFCRLGECDLDFRYDEFVGT